MLLQLTAKRDYNSSFVSSSGWKNQLPMCKNVSSLNFEVHGQCLGRSREVTMQQYQNWAACSLFLSFFRKEYISLVCPMHCPLLLSTAKHMCRYQDRLIFKAQYLLKQVKPKRSKELLFWNEFPHMGVSSLQEQWIRKTFRQKCFLIIHF